MEYDRTNIEKLYERLTIGDEDDGGIIVGIGEGQDTKESSVLVGRFLTDKNINFQAMKNTMAPV